MTTKEACIALRISKVTLLKWADTGKIQRLKDARNNRSYYSIPDEVLESYSVKEVCNILQISRSTLERLEKQGYIKSLKDYYPKQYAADEIERYRTNFYATLIPQIPRNPKRG